VVETLNDFHNTVKTSWKPPTERILGHVFYSPPLSLNMGRDGYTEDWALVEVDREKVDWEAFRGNVINLGTLSYKGHVVY
jgi:hypothetical protein